MSVNIGKNDWPLSKLPTLADRFAKVRTGLGYADRRARLGRAVPGASQDDVVRSDGGDGGSAAIPSFMAAMVHLETMPEADLLSKGTN